MLLKRFHVITSRDGITIGGVVLSTREEAVAASVAAVEKAQWWAERQMVARQVELRDFQTVVEEVVVSACLVRHPTSQQRVQTESVIRAGSDLTSGSDQNE